MRRTKPEKRVIPGDVRYSNVLVQGFINRLMRRGKKSTATRIVYEAFDLIQAAPSASPLEVFEQAIKNVSPDARGQASPGRRRDLPGAG